jgi:hypothetical protein
MICATAALRRILAPRIVATIIAFVAGWAPVPAVACILATSVKTDLGTYSPNAVKAKAVPALRSTAGLQCDSSLLVLLGGNFIRAKFNSANAFKLVRDGGGSIMYKASADPDGTYLFAQGTTIDYMQNNLLNLLGLLGNSSAELPIFVKPDDLSLPPVGVYRDRITINWNWDLCPGGIKLFGICVGVPDTDTGISVIDITLNVTPQNATISMTSVATWDPVNTTNSPKAIPGSRFAISATFSNPDIVPLEPGAIDVVIPTPRGATLALDGDMATSGTVIRLIEGPTPSSVVARYGGPGDGGDDVYFSADKGTSWSYMPLSGNAVSQAAVTHVRMRARGTMAKTSSFVVRVPFIVN